MAGNRTVPNDGHRARLSFGTPRGHELGRSTIQRILSDHGIEPSPERKGRMRWKTFLKAHWEVIAAADFCAAHCRVSRLLMDSC